MDGLFWRLTENDKILPIFHILSFNPNFIIADCTVDAKTSTRTKRSFFRSMILGPFVVWHLSISPYSGPTESPNQAHNWVAILKLRVKSQTVITSRVISELTLVNLSNNGTYHYDPEKFSEAPILDVCGAPPHSSLESPL